MTDRAPRTTSELRREATIRELRIPRAEATPTAPTGKRGKSL
jgi:hypothetical protein